MKLFNPLDYPILFTTPVRLTRYSFWQEHIPFGMFLVQMLEPRLLVELGTHYGDSYCAFCQVVKELELPTLCYAVDNWQGDVHVGEYSSAVLNELREHHDPLYGSFSTLVQNDFVAARADFADNSIDLLHLDGTHTYEAVKDDFYGWLPKLSNRGVVLFHDTNVLDRNFGVRRFFDEIKQDYPHFEFLHGYGLGVLAIGTEQPESFRALLEARGSEIAAIRRVFYAQGQRLFLLRRKSENEDEIRRLDRHVVYQSHEIGLRESRIAELTQQQESRIAELTQQQESRIAELTQHQESVIAALAQAQHEMNAESERSIRSLQTQLDQIVSSNGWALLQKLWSIRSMFKSSTALPDSQLETVERIDKTEPAPSLPLPSLTPAETVTEQVAPVLPPPEQPVLVTESSPEPVVPDSCLTPEMLDSLNRNNRQELSKLAAADLRAIAFYLPQFHPIPENDQWWGKGFTEWTNVSKAKPNFVGHYQPHLPADLGFYDLRVPEVREQQAELAKAYGIHGFCYHHYWFGGRRLLERPFNEVLKSGRPDFPFCISWANENWTRRWDGLDHELLISQNHSEEDDLNFIRDLFPAFEDHRYIRVNGKPLLIVYRANVLPEAAFTAERWRKEARRAGIGELYLVAAQTFGFEDSRQYGFDAAVEFPPLNTICDHLTPQITKLNPDFAGNVLDYGSMVKAMTLKPDSDYKLFRTVMPGWDNTPRRQNDSYVFLHSSPEAYEYWLSQAVRQTIAANTGDERLVFINAWNEWAEGAHLEPDRQSGYQYLEATRNVIQAAQSTF